MNLDGKVAVVTGGAKGNGRGIVDVFVSRGVKVAILDYSEELRNVINELASKGHDVCGYKVDIREKDKVDDVYSEILKDADVLAQYFAETDIVLSDEGQKRLKKYLPEKI